MLKSHAPLFDVIIAIDLPLCLSVVSKHLSSPWPSTTWSSSASSSVRCPKWHNLLSAVGYAFFMLFAMLLPKVPKALASKLSRTRTTSLSRTRTTITTRTKSPFAVHWKWHNAPSVVGNAIFVLFAMVVIDSWAWKSTISRTIKSTISYLKTKSYSVLESLASEWIVMLWSNGQCFSFIPNAFVKLTLKHMLLSIKPLAIVSSDNKLAASEESSGEKSAASEENSVDKLAALDDSKKQAIPLVNSELLSLDGEDASSRCKRVRKNYDESLKSKENVDKLNVDLMDLGEDC